MHKSLTALAAASIGLTLAGCSNPPPVVQPDPLIIEHEKTLDRVHVRDDSMEFYDESRGGAAVRHHTAAHVLWNEHYEADAAALAAKAEAERLASAARYEEAARQAALKEAQPNAEVAKKMKNGKNGMNAGIGTSKNRSIYKDQSVYKEQTKPRKVHYLRTKAPAPAVQQKPASKSEAEKNNVTAPAPASAAATKAAIAPKANDTFKEAARAKVEAVRNETSVAHSDAQSAPKTEPASKPTSKFTPNPEVVKALKVEPMPENPTAKPRQPGEPCCGTAPDANAVSTAVPAPVNAPGAASTSPVPAVTAPVAPAATAPAPTK